MYICSCHKYENMKLIFAYLMGWTISFDMSLIQNYVTDVKMATVVGYSCKICMGDYGEKNFEWRYLSQEGRYRAGMALSMYKRFLADYQNNARFLFFQLIYI